MGIHIDCWCSRASTCCWFMRRLRGWWTPSGPLTLRWWWGWKLCSLYMYIVHISDPKLICGGFGREKPSWSWTTRHNSWRNQHQRSDSWRHSGTQSGWLWESGLNISKDGRSLHVKNTVKVGVPRKSFDSSLLVLFCRWAHPIWENFPFSRSGPRAVRAAWILEAHRIRSPIVQPHMLRKSVPMTQSQML